MNLKNHKYKNKVAFAFKFATILLSVLRANVIPYFIFQLAWEIKYISIETGKITHVNRGSSYDPTVIYFTDITWFSN